MDYFEVGDLVFDFSQLNSNAILKTIQNTLENDTTIRRKIAQHQESAKASSYKQFDYLFNLLDQGNSCN
jgi:hypothetical protein